MLHVRNARTLRAAADHAFEERLPEPKFERVSAATYNRVAREILAVRRKIKTQDLYVRIKGERHVVGYIGSTGAHWLRVE
jgi:hypothetical protein